MLWAAVANFFLGLWSRFQAVILAIVAFAVALAIAFWKGRQSGKDAIIEEQKQKRADALVERKQVDEQIDAAPAADVDSRLDRWMRD